MINPFGGNGKAMKIYREAIASMFEHSHFEVDVLTTQRAGHGYEVGKTLVLGHYDGIVTASGDGLLHEVVNGLMAHSQWAEAIKTPIGIIPCGSGNGLAVSIGTDSQYLLPFVS